MKILIVEDDTLLLQGLILAAQTEGYACDGVSTARMAEQSLEAGHYSLVVLDLGLPDEDGLHFLARIRQKKYTLPVLILTARDTLTDKIAGLDVGADDYLVKPFHLKELMARVRALIRRPGQIRDGENISWGDLKLDRETRELWCHKNRLKLTARESELLYTLMDQPERVFTRDQLVLKVWGSDSGIEPGNVDNYISFLRKRLREVKSRCGIKTIYGTGFQMEEPYA